MVNYAKISDHCSLHAKCPDSGTLCTDGEVIEFALSLGEADSQSSELLFLSRWCSLLFKFYVVLHNSRKNDYVGNYTHKSALRLKGQTDR